jgi:hypothetical protein
MALVEIATIGSLVGITKGLIDIVKGAGSFFSGGPAKDTVTLQVAKLYGRIEQLAIQLEQCERLTRTVPAWMGIADRMPMWAQVSSLSPERAQSLDRDLRGLIDESVRDTFSGTFFRSDVDRLPDIPDQIRIFRARLTSLDTTISAIPPGNLPALQALWGQITTQFNDARNSARDIQRRAEDLQADLIRELREAASDGLGALKKV